MAEPTKAKKNRYKFFIGSDISRNELDFVVMENKILLFHKEIKNEQGAIISFVSELKKIPGFKMTKSLFCMEDRI